jgi:hypothetical protein
VVTAPNVNVFIAIFHGLAMEGNVRIERKGLRCGPLATETFPALCTQSANNVCPFIGLEDS